MADPLFTVGGLASGIDSSSIIDKLVALEQKPLDLLKAKQSAFNLQISTLATLTSKLAALQTAANDLSTGGALGLKTVSSNTSFTAVPGSSGTAGAYDLQVQSLATAAKWRSTGLAPTDTLHGGTFTLSAGDPNAVPPPVSYSIPVTPGASLADIAFGIRQSGAPVSAVVLDDGTKKYLSITAMQTGTPMSVGFTPDAGTGVDPTAGADVVSKPPTSATFTLDGLSFTRPSNVVADALPGVAFTLKSAGGPAETLSIANDPDATQAKLKTFADAYNSVMSLVQGQLSPSKDTDRSKTLAGDSVVRSLQSALQKLGSSQVAGLSTVRSLADAGLKTGRDGTLSVDSAALTKAMARDPAALNALFSDPAGGVGKLATSLVAAYTASGSGLLVSDGNGLTKRVKDMDTQAANIQHRIDSFRASLVAQFTAMESVVSGLKASGNFLTQQMASMSNSK